MSAHTPYPCWRALLDAPRSALFRGHTADTLHDQETLGPLSPAGEALFTQSNARVLLGQAANGMLRFVAMPTQVYPAPPQTPELGLGPGMYHHFDVAMYAGDLSYQLLLAGSDTTVDLAGDDRDNETVYADHFLPLTHTRVGDLEVALVSVAPVAADSDSAPLTPAPLPGPAGAIYALWLHNTGTSEVEGSVILRASDMLVGHYEDADPTARELTRPDKALRQQTVVLMRPDGAVGVHLHEGRWTRTDAPFQAERSFRLQPGEEMVIETHVALGRTYDDIMPVIYALHLHSSLEWLNLTAGYWRSRLGTLQVEAGDGDDGAFSRDIYIRSLFDNLNCLQTDADGHLIAHWQGAPSHGYGTIWGIDVEPTAVSIVHLCPELARQAMSFFATRSRAPKGPPDHSVPILVAPVIIARQWLAATGDMGFLEAHPEVLSALQSIMDDLEALRAPYEVLFPSRYSSDGSVGRRHDYGTNVKVLYAFDSFAYILRQLGSDQRAARYARVAAGIREAIERTMVVEGPFGPQLSGGTNLNDEPGTFYLPEGVPYYDGEDTSSMLAPIYGACDYGDVPWVNYHRFARSLWCPNYDPEFDVLRWNPGVPGVCDGTAFFSRLGGSLTPVEMRQALATLRRLGTDDATGSIFWWPHGLEYKRSLTRCSQGQGAWAWQYLEQWLGIKIDAVTRTLTLAPRGLLSRVDWQGLASGPYRFDVHWAEENTGAVAQIRNRSDGAWTVRVGFRTPNAGAEGPLCWQTQAVEPGGEVSFAHQATPVAERPGLDRGSMVQAEVQGLGTGDGVVFGRIAPDQLWGHWDASKMWDMQAMPLALRFVIANASEHDWANVTVEVTCPDGWLAAERQPCHWTWPEAWTAGTVCLELGRLPSPGRTVAPFWVIGPGQYRTERSWDHPNRPFHHASPPEEGFVLRGPGNSEARETAFVAVLHAVAANGDRLRRELRVPVRIVP